MAVYKVPQDVEAEDKLIGPFGFRQFIYLVIAAIAIAIGWGLSQIFIPLAIIPLPIVLFFGALALPLRKDQPMEIYLAAVVSFYLKPRKRLWVADGIQSLVEITAPKTPEVHRTKTLSQDEAEQRLSYLADIVDTQGWAVRGVGIPGATSAMQSDAYFEAQQTEDVLDESASVSRSFDTMISQSDMRHREEIVSRISQPPTTSTPPPATNNIPDPYTALSSQPPVIDDAQAPHFNPYPNAIHQSVIAPLSDHHSHSRKSSAKKSTAKPAPSTSVKPPSPDIINLANNTDLSIETIAHEANRIHQKEADLAEDEVVISLR